MPSPCCRFPCSSPRAPLAGFPDWLKRPLPVGNENFFTNNLLRELRLETVCENARCPNRPECYSRRTATFMILGNVCTRPCGFCSVPRGTPEALEDDEPERVAEAAARLGLKHVVITSVTRDDLPDGGADHFYRCVLAVRAAHRGRGRGADARLPRRPRPPSTACWRRSRRCSTTTRRRCRASTARCRGRADYQRSLDLLAHVKRQAPGHRRPRAA